MAKRKRRRVVRKRKKRVEEEIPEEEVKEEEEPTPAPEKKVIRRKKKIVKKPKAEPEEEPKKKDKGKKDRPKHTVVEQEPEPERGKVVFKSEPFADFLSVLMNEGKAVLITPNTDGSFTMQQADAVSAERAAGKKLSGVEFWREVANPEYVKWQEDRRGMTMEDKVAVADKLGIDPEVYEYKTDKIKLMRLTSATVEALGIEKYKKKYRDRAARAVIKGGR